MILKTTMYYGKKYGLVYASDSKKEANIHAHIINNIFGDYGKGALRTKLQKMKNLVLIDNIINDGSEMHLIYVKQPYDKIVKKI